MKLKDERDKLEDLLNQSPDKMTENVPIPGAIPEELQIESVMGLDFAEIKELCNTQARIMIQNVIGFILDDEALADNKYLNNKLEVDVMTLSGMIYQVRVNEAMQKAMMEEVDRGFMHPRMFEVFGGLSKIIAEINKQLLQTVEAIKMTYKDVKADIRENQTDALGQGEKNEQGMITQGDGGVVSMGTKELINRYKHNKPQEPQDIEDTEEVQ